MLTSEVSHLGYYSSWNLKIGLKREIDLQCKIVFVGCKLIKCTNLVNYAIMNSYSATVEPHTVITCIDMQATRNTPCCMEHI